MAFRVRKITPGKIVRGRFSPNSTYGDHSPSPFVKRNSKRRRKKSNRKREVAITGNTYPVKDQLKALGARWNPDQKAWMVAPEKADAARKIVAGTPQHTARGFARSKYSNYPLGDGLDSYDDI